ncbi:MAG: glucosamine-6-phosphate isomerase [Lentisphaerae bacterium]|nr:glucosamine-6-phosphate isomerase [Lentisphaerota bacterium]
MNRKEEVRYLLSLTTGELIAASKGQLKLTATLDELYEYLAEEMVAEFRKAAAGNKIVNFIMPVGPTQPYRIMAEKINFESIPLKNVRFFFMDEYVDDEKDELIPESSPLSFRRQIGPLFFDRVRPELLMPADQVIFPRPEILADLPGMIESTGGIEVCFGGIGIHGHVAFNEPAPGVADTDPRILDINEFTRTIDATRHKGVGGNLENFPRRAITLGMKQCLSARRMLLMTRNESSEFLWANTIIRIAAAGQPGDDYPVTYCRRHPNCTIVSDIATATAPKFNI